MLCSSRAFTRPFLTSSICIGSRLKLVNYCLAVPFLWSTKWQTFVVYLGIIRRKCCLKKPDLSEYELQVCFHLKLCCDFITVTVIRCFLRTYKLSYFQIKTRYEWLYGCVIDLHDSLFVNTGILLSPFETSFAQMRTVGQHFVRLFKPTQAEWVVDSSLTSTFNRGLCDCTTTPTLLYTSTCFVLSIIHWIPS